MKDFLRNDDGLAAIESALIFPILLMLLLGTFDMGNAILANTKTVRASQVAADLVTRARTVSDSDINEAIEAARLAFEPLPSETFGIDIISVRFDEDADASIEWRETRNMTADPDVLTEVASLAEDDGGVVVVHVRYDFVPFFGEFITGDIPMNEVAFARGRKSAVVERE